MNCILKGIFIEQININQFLRGEKKIINIAHFMHWKMRVEME
jgi:hypothetical protein